MLGDYFTRLVPCKVEKGSLFEVLVRTCDPLRLRWDERGGWLTFRSTDFFNMRLKEVPARLLEKWAAQRKKSGSLSPDDLREISRLTDDQLDASSMAEGAKTLYGLDGQQKFLLAAYQHNPELLETIRQGGASEAFVKGLESSLLKLSLPVPSASQKPGEAPYLFEFRIPMESGTAQMIKKVGPNSTSSYTPH